MIWFQEEEEEEEGDLSRMLLDGERDQETARDVIYSGLTQLGISAIALLCPTAADSAVASPPSFPK